MLKFLTWLWLLKVHLFEGGLKKIETLKVRALDGPEVGFDAKVWWRGKGVHYFFTVADFYGGFPEDWEPPESSNAITPAMYLDVMEHYLNIHAYVERLNTGESIPGDFEAAQRMMSLVPSD